MRRRIANEEAEIGFTVSASFFMACSHCFASVGIDGLCHFEQKRERLITLMSIYSD